MLPRTVLQCPPDRQRLREWRVPLKLFRIQSGDELGQRQRVALCRVDESFRDVGIDRPAREVFQQRGRVGMRQSENLELRQDVQRVPGAGFGVA